MEDLEDFYDGLPAHVRRELSFMLVCLSGESAGGSDAADYEAAARKLFDARTRLGRLSDRITVAAIFDVYFAMDARQGFDPGRTEAATAALDGVAGRIDTIEAAGRHWAELRGTRLAPAVIAAAPVPQERTGARSVRLM
jgi:hypothetical protein